MRRVWIRGVLAILGLAAASPASVGATAAADTGDDAAQRALTIERRSWTGDLDGMIERRLIRVLVPFSRSLFYNDRGRERGLAAETLRDFEHYLNGRYRKSLARRPLTLVLIPTTRDRLLPELVEGLGDIAAGNLTATEERRDTVDFAAPDNGLVVRELLLTGPAAAPPQSIDDLSGRTVHVRPSSSYYQSLLALNGRLEAAGRAPVELVAVPDALEDEDMMEMLDSGLLQAIVVDDWKARIWAQILPHLRVHEDIVLREDGRVGWAFRKESPKLAAELLEFHKTKVAAQGLTRYRLQQLKRSVARLSDPTGDAEWQRFEATIAMFREYGERYGFDPLMLAAQGYQESRIDQSKRSPVGAIGIMQLMPATAKELAVGDISKAKANIHAGAKYMDQLMTRYFQDADFEGDNRTLFAFAAYNAGPGNIRKMRKLAAERGLDSNRWFNNVEIVTAEKIGLEPATYVRNIYKYYVSYRLAVEARADSQRAREALQASGR